jgi:hypothetical protein
MALKLWLSAGAFVALTTTTYLVINYVITKKNDVHISEIRKIDTTGSFFPSLTSSAAVLVENNFRVYVWGGMEVFSMRPTMKVKATKIEVELCQNKYNKTFTTNHKQTGFVPNACKIWSYIYKNSQ